MSDSCRFRSGNLPGNGDFNTDVADRAVSPLLAKGIYLVLPFDRSLLELLWGRLCDTI